MTTSSRQRSSASGSARPDAASRGPSSFIPVTTLQNWEQGGTPMDPSARAQMIILAREPEAALRALGYIHAA